MKGLVTAAAVAGMLVGAAGGWMVRGQHPAAAPPAGTQETVRLLPTACAGATPEQVRAIVEEAFAARAGSATTATATAAAEAAPAATKPPAEAVATAAVDQGLADGVWSDEDRQALHIAMAQAAASDAHDAMSHLAIAINEGRVRVATSGPPF